MRKHADNGEIVAWLQRQLDAISDRSSGNIDEL
jgi:hypothetical protein